MKGFLHRFRTSLSTRLSLGVVLFAALIFITAFGYMFIVSRKAVEREAVERATQILNNTVLRVNDILDDAQIAADNVDWLVYRHLDNPDMMYELARNVLLNNPEVRGCSISFEPGYFPEKGRYFSAYAYRDGRSVLTTQEGSDLYQYFYMDWYQLPKLLNQPCWTEPYMDADYEEKTGEMFTSYCKPLTGDDGSFIGSLSVDLSLSWLSETINSVMPYPNSYNIMIGRGGSYLVYPDTTKLLNTTIFTETLAVPDSEISALGHDMLRGDEGIRKMFRNGEEWYVFYQPIKATGWSVGIVCPRSEIFSSLDRLRHIVMTIIVIGLLLMLLVCSRVVSSELKPLGELVRQTDEISAGCFDAPLPQTERVDEIGQLTRSFSHMQTSLVNYIDELTRTTANKERIEGELRIAREIQMSMVPRVFPPFPERKEIDLYALMTPAKEVGGDLYDYFLLRNTLYFCIGDVSGKGIPGSLVMAVVRNLSRVVARQDLVPAQIARQINDAVSAENEQMMFVTMIIGKIHLDTGRMEFCNCGHNPPVVFKEGEARFMDIKANVPLGIAPGFEFEGEEIADVREQPILFYTDGLNEAENAAHEQFGDDRILEVLRSAPFVSAQDSIKRINAALEAFVDGAEASDDLTMLCLEIKRNNTES